MILQIALDTPLRRVFDEPGIDPVLSGLARLDAAIFESAGRLDDSVRERVFSDVAAVHTPALEVLRPCVDDVFGSVGVFHARLGEPQCPYRHAL